MGRRRSLANHESVITKWIGDGRGQGTHERYQPWLRTYDVPSIGVRSRIWGVKTGRVVHLLSKLERAAFMECEWRDDVVDIREQFPLERVRTHRIALEMGVAHPVTVEGTPGVLSTDLLLTCEGVAGYALEAIAVKPSKALKERRVLEKLEIERRYWTAQGARWRLFTEADVDQARILNLETLRGYWTGEACRALVGARFDIIAQAWLAEIETGQAWRVTDCCKWIAAWHGCEPQAVMDVLMHLLSRKHVVTDLSADKDFSARELNAYWLSSGGSR